MKLNEINLMLFTVFVAIDSFQHEMLSIRRTNRMEMSLNRKDIFDENNGNSDRRRIIESSILSSVLSLINPYICRSEESTELSTSVKYAGTSTSPVIEEKAEEYFYEEIEKRRISVFEKVSPSVVFIDTFAEQRDAFSMNVMDVPLGAGSGFIWDDKGHIITNYHVIRNANYAQVAILTKNSVDTEKSSSKSSSKKKLRRKSIGMDTSEELIPYTSMRSIANKDPSITKYNRNVFKARVVGIDPSKDIAVLKVDAPVYDLHPIEIGRSDNLKVGQTGMAIGNPFGLDHSLTVGVISGLGREVKSPIGRPITNVIQTDAAVNPGNSGGPLLNGSGKLIGMNTAIYSTSGSSSGIGFAIPVDSVKYIVETLIRDGKIIRPIIGITYLESKQAYALGIKNGVLVLDVPINSAAYKAGLRGTRRSPEGLIEIGDIIIQIEDMVINTETNLFEALEKYKPGDRVLITVNRVEQYSLPKYNEDRLTMTKKTLTTQLIPSNTASLVTMDMK